MAESGSLFGFVLVGFWEGVVRRLGFDALVVFSRLGIDLDVIAFVDEERHFDGGTSFECGGGSSAIRGRSFLASNRTSMTSPSLRNWGLEMKSSGREICS